MYSILIRMDPAFRQNGFQRSEAFARLFLNKSKQEKTVVHKIFKKRDSYDMIRSAKWMRNPGKIMNLPGFLIGKGAKSYQQKKLTAVNRNSADRGKA